MKSLLLTITALPLLFTSMAYACDAHHDAHSQAPKQTITAKHQTKIQPTTNKKAEAIKTQQTLNQNTKTVNKQKV